MNYSEFLIAPNFEGSATHTSVCFRDVHVYILTSDSVYRSVSDDYISILIITTTVFAIARSPFKCAW